jgi:TolA-binding protein
VFRAIHHLTDEARAAGLASGHAAITSSAGSRTFLLLAASLMAAVGVTAWLATRTPAPDAQAGTSGAPPPAAVTTTPPPQARAWALALSAPAVELPARYALVTRGGEADRAFLEAFGAAIAPYRVGDYTRAATALADVCSRFPDVPEAAFYLGAARLLSGDAAGARAPLADATRAEALGDAARWLGAVAAERSGASGDADTALTALCEAAGTYQAQACAALGRSTAKE